MSIMPRFYLPYLHSMSKVIATIWLAFLTLLYGLILFSEVGVSWPFYAKIYFYAAAFSLCCAGLLWSHRIFQAARQLHTSTVPHTLWRAWLKGLLLKAWIYWVVFSLSMNLLEVTHLALSNWSAVWASSALSLSSTFLFVFVLSGFASRGLSLLLCAVFAWFLVASDITSPKDWAQQLWYGHLPYVLMWVAISFAVIFLWTSPPVPRLSGWTIPFVSRSGILQRIKNVLLFYRRYSPLDTARANKKADAPTIFYSSQLLQFSALFWFSVSVPSLTSNWGGAINLLHLLFLGFVSTLVGSYLVGRDLHWRFLLLPKGLQQGRIGTHILFSTLRYYAGFSLIIAALFWLLHLGVSQLIPTPASWITSKVGLALLELLMCVSIAIAVRGCQRPRRVFFYLFNGTLAISAVYSLVVFFQGKNPLTAPITTMNFPYLIAVIMISGSTLIMANKLWTQERLLPYLKAT